ncbi:UNVERIFIED_CONTAM: hypothetical protein FKN15_036249 [Acipenser sinensis]
MPLSPAASKHEPSDQQQQQEEVQQCATNGNQGDSDSSKEDIIYDTIRATAEKPPTSPMEEPLANTVVIRIGIPDLQQTLCFISAFSYLNIAMISEHPCSGRLWMSLGHCGKVVNSVQVQVINKQTDNYNPVCSIKLDSSKDCSLLKDVQCTEQQESTVKWQLSSECGMPENVNYRQKEDGLDCRSHTLTK